MPTYIFSLPDFHLPLINQSRGKHWRHEHDLKMEAIDMLATYALLHSVPPAKGKRKVTITMHGWPGKRRLPDIDAPLKLGLDCLVRAGLLTDDGPDGLAGMPVVEFVRSASKLTVITLEDC